MAVQDRRSGFRLLYVCTGNICRSPFAEILTRHLLVGRLGGRAAAAFDVRSAGLQAMPGARMHDDTRDELLPWGLDGVIAGRFAARRIDQAMISDADLVLGATPRHRAAVVECAPTALGTAFGLREFARLAAGVDPASLPDPPVARAVALVEQARLRRGLAPPARPDDDEVPDPIGRPPEVHHEAAMLIRQSVQTIVDGFAPARATNW